MKQLVGNRLHLVILFADEDALVIPERGQPFLIPRPHPAWEEMWNHREHFLVMHSAAQVPSGTGIHFLHPDSVLQFVAM